MARKKRFRSASASSCGSRRSLRPAAKPELLASLLRDIEKIIVPKPRLARDAHELRHHGGFRLFVWRYEVSAFCDPFGFHSLIRWLFYFAFSLHTGWMEEFQHWQQRHH